MVRGRSERIMMMEWARVLGRKTVWKKYDCE